MRKRLRNLYSEELVDSDYLPELVELGVLIGSHRTASGINQEEFARMIGVSRRTMTKIENGRQSLSFVAFFENCCCAGDATGVFAAGADAGDAEEVEYEGGGLRERWLVRT